VSEPVVSLSDVSLGFGDVTIVDGLTTAFQPGQVVALVGPNGSGKTTLLELLAGLRRPDSGSVERRAAERDAAYLPQSPSFRAGFSARETLRFYTELAGSGDDPAGYLEQVGLADAADRRVEALSGGMTRLLGIAQALIGDPPLVVLDEPTSGLDPGAADRVFAAAADITTERRAVVIASHDLVAVEREADRVVVLAGGSVVLDGPPAALLDRTGAASLRAVLGSLTAGDGDAPLSEVVHE